MLKEVGNSSYLDLFSIFRLKMVDSPRRRECSPRRRGHCMTCLSLWLASGTLYDLFESVIA